MIQGDGFRPSRDGAVVYLNAGPSLDAVLNRVAAAGGEIVLPKTALSGKHRLHRADRPPAPKATAPACTPRPSAAPDAPSTAMSAICRCPACRCGAKPAPARSRPPPRSLNIFFGIFRCRLDSRDPR